MLLELIQKTLDDFCDERRVEFEAISPDLVPLVDYTKSLLAGGKRFRALFAYWSWIGSLETSEMKLSDLQMQNAAQGMVGICAALEMFHAAALVHDDLLDQSDTRRGQMAVHKRFEALHEKENWAGSAERFGIAGSVLVGDLMLGWSSEIFGRALHFSPNYELEKSCRAEFSKMRVEVMAGQYLDVVEENAALTRSPEEAVSRANRVMLYKTAKYSIEAPLLIGSAFAGASAGLKRGLSAFGIPLGMAFQLKDDILGVFGDPSVTGKPAGDDLREGKRTVLVGYTREALSNSVGKLFDELLVSRDLDADQIRFLQQTISGCGALAKTEGLMNQLADQSLAALASLELGSEARNQLQGLAEKVINRNS